MGNGVSWASGKGSVSLPRKGMLNEVGATCFKWTLSTSVSVWLSHTLSCRIRKESNAGSNAKSGVDHISIVRPDLSTIVLRVVAMGTCLLFARGGVVSGGGTARHSPSQRNPPGHVTSRRAVDPADPAPPPGP